MNYEEIKSKIDFESINQLRLNNKKIIDKRSTVILSFNLLLLVALIIFVWPFLNFIAAFIIPIIIVIFIFSILHRLFIKKYEVQFQKSFSENVLDKLLHELKYDLRLNIENPLKQSEFAEGKIFANYNVFEPEELFEGKIDGIPLKFSEVTIQSKSRYSRTTHMRGFYANFYYGLNHEVVIDVIQDGSKNLGFLQQMNLKRDKLVKIEDSQFERKYVVYSKQPELATELLSHKFINELDKLSETLKSTLYFAVRKGSVHVAFDDSTDYFVIDVNKPVEELTENFYYDITKIYDAMHRIKSFFDTNLIPVVPK